MSNKGKNILFIYPPQGETLENISSPPLGLAYLASFIRRQLEGNCNVRIWDLNLNRINKEQFRENLLRLDEKPDIIGIGGIVTVFNHFLWISKICKDIFPDTLLVAGGSLASTVPHLLFKHSPVDICVKGEGEHTFLEILKNFEVNTDKKDIENIRGLFLWDKGQKRLITTAPRPHISNLDIIGMPAYDLIDVERYAKNGIRNLKDYIRDLPEHIFSAGNLHMSIITSRGCTGRCTFCYRHFPKIGINTSEFIKEHVITLHDRFGVNVLTIMDELFNISYKRMDEMISCFTELKCKTPNLYFRVSAARVDVVDVELLKKLKAAGCFQFTYGLESGSDKMLNAMKKRTNVQQNRNAVHAVRDAGLHCVPQFCIGLPGETKDTLKETFNFIKSIDFWSYLSIHKANAYPGSEIYEYAKDKGLIGDEFAYVSSLAGSDKYPLQLSNIPSNEMKRILRRFIIMREIRRMFREKGALLTFLIFAKKVFKKIRVIKRNTN